MLKVGAAAAAVLGAAVLAGCQARPKAEGVAPPATAEQLQQIREAFTQVDPTVRVGMVSEVDPGTRLATVSDVAPEDFRVGAPITFIDSNRDTIGFGRVVNVLKEMLVVRYVAPGADGREPRQGDLALKVLGG